MDKLRTTHAAVWDLSSAAKWKSMQPCNNKSEAKLNQRRLNAAATGSAFIACTPRPQRQAEHSRKKSEAIHTRGERPLEESVEFPPSIGDNCFSSFEEATNVWSASNFIRRLVLLPSNQFSCADIISNSFNRCNSQIKRSKITKISNVTIKYKRCWFGW